MRVILALLIVFSLAATVRDAAGGRQQRSIVTTESSQVTEKLDFDSIHDQIAQDHENDKEQAEKHMEESKKEVFKIWNLSIGVFIAAVLTIIIVVILTCVACFCLCIKFIIPALNNTRINAPVVR